MRQPARCVPRPRSRLPPEIDWAEHVDFVTEAEKLGLDICWVAEAWGSDGALAVGVLAARTERMLLGSGIMQLGTRTPVAIAQTAITLSQTCPTGGSCSGWAPPGRR